MLVGEIKFSCIDVYGLKFSSRKSLLLVSGSLMIFADPEIAKAYAVHIASFAPGEHHHSLRSRMEGFEWKNLCRKHQIVMGAVGWTRPVEDVEDSWRTCDRCQDLVVRVVGSNLDLKLDMPVDSCDTLSLRFNQTVSFGGSFGFGGLHAASTKRRGGPHFSIFSFYALQGSTDKTGTNPSDTYYQLDPLLSAIEVPLLGVIREILNNEMLVQLYWQVEGNMCCLFGARMS